MSVEEQITQLEAAIAAQEMLRQALGDATVEVAISALRLRLQALTAQRDNAPRPHTGLSPEELLSRLQSYLPRQLAEKMRATGRIEGERKQVTVLFADLSGFTALAERLDAEEVALLTNEALKEMAEAVYLYEGYIDKFIGDAIMAVFGAPVAHEDDPERALRAALAMRERLERFNRRFAERLQQPLSLHMGINTGQVIAGNVGSDLRLSYTMMGDTVNTASRLEGAAGAGQILVSRDTYRLAHEAFTFAALEPITVKGKREPLPVYELRRAKLVPGKSRGLSHLPSVFVGREKELETLRAVARELREGQGRVITLVGEAGLGKSRLLAEWRTQIGPSAQWLEGRAFSHTTSYSFGPLLDLLRRFAGIKDEDSEEKAHARLRAAVEKRFPGDAQAQALMAHLLAMRLSPEEDALLARFSRESLRRALFELMEQLLALLARERRIWLVVEDLHWVDLSSVELIEHLLPLCRRYPIAFIAVTRPNLPEPAQRLLHTLETAYADLHVHLPLAPLSERSSLGMVEQLLSLRELPPTLQELILHKAEGNPFFVEEVIRSLIERGALVPLPSGDGWTATPLMERVSVPDTLQGVLMARLDRLPEETKWVVQQASVIGRVFLYRVLRQMAVDMPGLDSDLDYLEREELIRERAREPEIEYVFKHALTQEAAYQSLLGPRRKELHRKVAEVMERVFADRLSAFHGILAEHFFRGEAWEKARDYFVKAGDAAERLNAYAEARQHYAKALEALGYLPEAEEKRRQRVDTLLRQVAVSFADDPSQNLDRLVEAEALAKELPEAGAPGSFDWRAGAKVQFWLGRAHFYRNDLHEAMACFQRLLESAREHGDEALVTTASMMMGRVMLFQGHFERAEKLAAQAITPLQRAGNWQEWIWSLGYHGASLAARGRYAEGREQGELGMACAYSLNNLTHVGAIQICRAIIHLHGGEMEAMKDAGRGVWMAAEKQNDRLYVYLGFGLEAWAQARLGRLDDAQRLFEKAKALREGLGGRLAAMDWFAVGHAEVALMSGRMEEALSLAEVAVDVAHACGGVFAEGLAHRVWGEALAAEGRWEPAKAHLGTSLRLLQEADALAEAARTRVVLAKLAQLHGEAGEAREQLERAAEFFEAADLQKDLKQVELLRRERKRK